MLWRDNRRSDNVEDRRGLSSSGFDGSGGGDRVGLLRLLPVVFKFTWTVVTLLKNSNKDQSTDGPFGPGKGIDDNC